MKTLHLLLFAVATNLCLAEENKPDLDDPATLKRILAEAIASYELEERDHGGEDLIYAEDSQTPYTGWAKLVKKGKVENIEHYKGGKLHGLEVWWFENGQKYSVINYKDGKKHGLEARWFENGQKEAEVNRKDGEFHGLVTKWRKDGKIWFRKNYLDDDYHGLSTEWHENGQKKKETNYKNGEKHGLQTWWDKEGNVIRQSRWENNNEVETIK